MLDPFHLKARYRRLQARKAMGMYDSALCDAKAMLRIDQDCSEAQVEMEELERLRQLRSPSWNGEDDEDDSPNEKEPKYEPQNTAQILKTPSIMAMVCLVATTITMVASEVRLVHSLMRQTSSAYGIDWARMFAYSFSWVTVNLAMPSAITRTPESHSRPLVGGLTPK
ncbi:hypothetical protein K439DRAFT_139785 [Ramaria rubella]|nr:hypothetical protein K439DRAFT_139785 [Ramaria rubella]